MEAVGKTIRLLLERKNLKQKDLAKELGVQSSAVSQWVRGKTQIDPKNLPGLAKFLDVTVDDLLRGKIPEELEDQSGFFTEGNIASVRPNITEYYTAIPFLSARAQAGIPLMTYDNFTLDWIEEMYPVFLPLISVTERHLIIEVAGDSMEPTIAENALVLAEAVKQDDIKYESGGVFAVLYGNSRFVIKRIKTNDLNTNGSLTLWSDNDRYGNIVVHGEDIRFVWRIIEKVREKIK